MTVFGFIKCQRWDYTTLWKKREDWKEYPVHGNIYWKKRYIREEKHGQPASYFSAKEKSLLAGV